MARERYRKWDISLKETLIFTDRDGNRQEAKTLTIRGEKLEVSPSGYLLAYGRDAFENLFVKTVIDAKIWWMVHDGGECDSDDE